MSDAALIDRLVALAETDAASDCLLWKGSINKFGFGRTKYKGKTINVHRAMWIAVHGDIPEGECVLHTCHVKHCINDRHLLLGERAAVLYHMFVAGRRRSGSGTYKPRKKKTVRRWWKKPVAEVEMFVANKLPT